MDEIELENQSMIQKKMAFAGSDHLATVIQLLTESAGIENLVGDTEYETLVNAITLDAQQNMIKSFIASIDRIKSGGLHQQQ